jgi:hypothetical protein
LEGQLRTGTYPPRGSELVYIYIRGVTENFLLSPRGTYELVFIWKGSWSSYISA